MTLNITPLHDRVLVRRLEEKETAKGGIIIPDTAKEKPQEGEVMAVGAGKVEKGRRIPLDVKAGDRILFGKYTGSDIKIDDQEYLILREDEILALARGSARTGEPIVRSLEYAFPHQGYERVNDEFLLGDRMLVAPVVEKDARHRMVNLPPSPAMHLLERRPRDLDRGRCIRRGRVPVVVFVGALSEEDSVGLARHAEKTGANALVVISPYCRCPSHEEIYESVVRTGTATGLPILAYNSPWRNGEGVEFTGDLTRRLIERLPNFVGMTKMDKSADDSSEPTPGFVAAAAPALWPRLSPLSSVAYLSPRHTSTAQRRVHHRTVLPVPQSLPPPVSGYTTVPGSCA